MSLCFIIVSVEKPHYHLTGVTSLHHLVRCESEEQSEGSRLLTESLTLQVGGLWLYPVLMRAAQLWILLSKSIKRANKSRAVTQRSQQAGGGCKLGTTGPRWWTLSGIRERSPWRRGRVSGVQEGKWKMYVYKTCSTHRVYIPTARIYSSLRASRCSSKSSLKFSAVVFHHQWRHRATFPWLIILCFLHTNTPAVSQFRSASFRGGTEGQLHYSYDPSWPHVSQDSLHARKIRKKETKWRHCVV